ncbi:MAG TPA: NAD(P)-binding domain-containing protein [Nitrososphaerales archaeon]|nr:NAD(P)-binding domain-containing protein [Nitrososphaerales archaeon]
MSPEGSSTVGGNEGDGLAQLRSEIETVTRSIIDQISKRQALSVDVARAKKIGKLPIENLKVESELRRSIGEYAESVGVDRSLADDVLQDLITSSKNQQRRELYRDEIVKFLDNAHIRNVTVIGAGRMGKWVSIYFQGLGRNVTLTDNKPGKAQKLALEVGCKYATALEKAFAESDLVVIAVSIENTSRMICEIMKISRRQEGVDKRFSPLRLIELTSVKFPLARSGLIHQENSKIVGNLRLHSIHPLFGPDAHPFAPNSLIEIRTKSQRPDAFISNLFPQFKIRHMTWEDHDAMMSIILSLPHLLAFVFADVVVRNKDDSLLSEGKKRGLEIIAGPSFDRMLQFSRRVFSESPDVYFEIQSLNKYNERLISQLQKSLETVTKLRRDKGRFETFFAKMATSLEKLDSSTA